MKDNAEPAARPVSQRPIHPADEFAPGTAPSGCHPPEAARPPDYELTERLLPKRAVTAMIGVAYPTLWSWMQKGQFPRALDCNGIPRWRLSELTQWIATRERRRIKGDPPQQNVL